MFGTLLLKECKGILKSITYYFFLICMVVFFIGQMGTIDPLVKPKKGGDCYGLKSSTDQSVIMQNTLDVLVAGVAVDQFITYPIGFYKEVNIDDGEKKELITIIENITGKSETEVSKYFSGENLMEESLAVKEDLTYKEFESYMTKVCKIVGKGSDFEPEHLANNGEVEMTYEDAMKDYQSIIKDDMISRAYARLFADYMGIVLSILPIFLAVNLFLKDRKAKADQVIFSKKVSSFKIITARYLAIIIMILLPTLFISMNSLLQCAYMGNNIGVQIDYFAFVKIIFFWLLPTILFTTSIGMFVTVISNGPLAIFIQGIYWLVSIFASMYTLVGSVGWNLIPRFNVVGKYDIYEKIFNQLLLNRMLYCGLGIVLLLSTIGVYNLKRRGRILNNESLLKYRKGIH